MSIESGKRLLGPAGQRTENPAILQIDLMGQLVVRPGGEQLGEGVLEKRQGPRGA